MRSDDDKLMVEDLGVKSLVSYVNGCFVTLEVVVGVLSARGILSGI